MRRSRKTAPSRRRKTRYWSKHVMETSDALDLEHRVFRSTSAKAIAASLKNSALASRRRKGTPFQSAMSMLNFYINRAGRKLSTRQKKVLERAKDALRQAFRRDTKKPSVKTGRRRTSGRRPR